MRYTTEVTVDLPRRQVVALFDDADNLAKWQEGLLAVSDMIYETQPGKTMTLRETIERNALPAEFIAVYEGRGAWNRHANFFHEDGDRTLYATETEFRFTGLMRVVSLFMKKAFQRETLRQMLAFKAFCENE